MGSGRKKHTYVQCQICGKVFQVPYTIEIDKLYIETKCSNCGETTVLNLGENEEDYYEFYNVNVDPRYY